MDRWRNVVSFEGSCSLDKVISITRQKWARKCWHPKGRILITQQPTTLNTILRIYSFSLFYIWHVIQIPHDPRNIYLLCPGYKLSFIYRRQYSRSGSGGAGKSYSGKAYDRWAYEQATPGSNDTPLNKLQKKFWITKQERIQLKMWKRLDIAPLWKEDYFLSLLVVGCGKKVREGWGRTHRGLGLGTGCQAGAVPIHQWDDLGTSEVDRTLSRQIMQ